MHCFALSREILHIDGVKKIVLAGERIEYNSKFRLFISTKYPNPRFSPEICSQATLINFTTTPQGLTDLLLNNLLEVEKSELDKKRIQIAESNAENFKRLKAIEVEILSIVSNVGSNILDDDNAVDTLQASQKTSALIEQQMSASEKTEQQISKFKRRFASVAERAALLYFCVSDLSVIDPMYQFSLRWFVPLFRAAIASIKHSDDNLILITSMHKAVTLNFYQSVSLSLFSKHKLLFSTLMALRIQMADRKISATELNFFLQPGITTENKPYPWFPDSVWKNLGAIGSCGSQYGSILHSLYENEKGWKAYLTTREKEAIPYLGACSAFQRLLILRLCHRHRICDGIRIFIEETLGAELVKPPIMNLRTIFERSDGMSPIVFITQTGIDPQDEIRNVLTSMDLDRYTFTYSLGRGRGAGAEELIMDGIAKGFIIVLQNCHLSMSWMPRLEYIVSHLNPQRLHSRFRLVLVTMSSELFPIGILYQATKLVYEIPKGIREKVLRIYDGHDPETYNHISFLTPERQLIFNLAYLNAIILERLQFGSIGWNTPYEFNASDFTISQNHLKAFLSEAAQEEVPWESLRYMIGTINYGGRVTDDWDQRLLSSLVMRCFRPQALTQSITMTSQYIPPAPDATHKQIIDTIDKWPNVTEGIDIGLSANASAIAAQNEAMRIFSWLFELQSIASHDEMTSQDDAALTSVTLLMEMVPEPFNVSTFTKKYDLNDTMNQVLCHEIGAFNKLIGVIRQTMSDVISGLKGLVVVDSGLDRWKQRLLADRVPEEWNSVSYPTVLGLKGYLTDLAFRVSFFKDWINDGPPSVYHLGAFFRPEEFLTAILQIHARKKDVSFESLVFVTQALDEGDPKNITEPSGEGVYIAGLQIEGAKWDIARRSLSDCGPTDIHNYLPVLQLRPSQNKLINEANSSTTYECPVYRTQSRGTGALDVPNYILSLWLPTPKVDPSHWIQRSVAAFVTPQ